MYHLKSFKIFESNDNLNNKVNNELIQNLKDISLDLLDNHTNLLSRIKQMYPTYKINLT
jgi:hypothetical protein